MSAEERISKWITKIVGGSSIVAILFFSLIWFFMALAHGDYEILYSSTTVKFAITGALYIYSLYLVGTLPSKSNSRRAFTWVFSIVFHAGLLLYIGIVLGAGGITLILGMVEITIFVLSVCVLSLCMQNIYSKKLQ